MAVTLPDYTPPGGSKITAVSRTEYDALGRMTAATDPLGRTSRFVYDQFGNLVQQTVPVAGGTPSLEGPRGRYVGVDVNLIYAAGQGWKNLGTAIDSRTGADVPLPGQP
ncbi:RHS repeat domain-containing protein [Streptomyces sp. NPDC001514]